MYLIRLIFLFLSYLEMSKTWRINHFRRGFFSVCAILTIIRERKNIESSGIQNDNSKSKERLRLFTKCLHFQNHELIRFGAFLT